MAHVFEVALSNVTVTRVYLSPFDDTAAPFTCAVGASAEPAAGAAEAAAGAEPDAAEGEEVEEEAAEGPGSEGGAAGVPPHATVTRPMARGSVSFMTRVILRVSLATRAPFP